MPKEDTQFNSKTGSSAGQKSKRGISLKSALIKMFKDEIAKNGKITPENFVKACTLNGMKGNSGLARLVWEYLEGKPKEKVEITTPVDVKVTFE